MAENSQKAANRASRGRGPGRPFPPGVSGNAGGRPKGIPTFSILRMVAEALTDEATRKEAILRLRDSLKQRKTVVQTLEFAARVNREIGLGSEERVGGVTIIFQTNLKPGSLKRPVLCHASIGDGAGPTASLPGCGRHPHLDRDQLAQDLPDHVRVAVELPPPVLHDGPHGVADGADGADVEVVRDLRGPELRVDAREVRLALLDAALTLAHAAASPPLKSG